MWLRNSRYWEVPGAWQFGCYLWPGDFSERAQSNPTCQHGGRRNDDHCSGVYVNWQESTPA